MDIYLQSRTKNADYYWVSQSTAPEKVHTVPSIIQSVTKFNGDKDLKLIHESEPSMVLLRSQGELLLLVSGLRTKRQDKDRRYIRNSIAWVGEKTDEPILREIAALVLKNNLQILENVVSESSNSSGELFEVNWQAIKQLIPPNVGVTSHSPQENGKIALFSEQPKQQLVDELRKCALPARDGALIAATTEFKPKAVFIKANVWRGLSNDTSLSPEWESTLTSSSPVPSHQPNPKRLVIIIAGSLIIFLAVSVFLSLYQRYQINMSQTPTSTSTPTSTQLTEYCKGEHQIVIDTNKIQLTTSSKLPPVKPLQEILKKLGKSVGVDGSFGNDTQKAVKEFQNDYRQKNPNGYIKLNEDNGKVATNTWNALLEKTKDIPALTPQWKDVCKTAKK
ncbi:peptidoglycan-binding protein [Dolichospermum sp. ST_sed9]|nr:peptidoglycan-binding protein [Dolichospermum sp. ST_sed9]